jgi:uncharacterized repeat protein (TIGR01451 family)
MKRLWKSQVLSIRHKSTARNKFWTKEVRGKSRRRLRLEILEQRQMLVADIRDGLMDDFVSTVASGQSVGEFLMTPTSLSRPTLQQEGEGEGEGAADKVAFAKALSAAGAVFYGADWSEVCAQQRALFEDGSVYLSFVEVTNPDRTPNSIATQENITTYPTWKFADGQVLTGLQSLAQLSTTSGVAIPNGSNPSFVEIPNQTVLFRSPLHIPIDAYDPNGGPVSVTVESSNPSVIAAEVIGNSKSLRMLVDGYGEMVFRLFADDAARPVGRIEQLVNSGFYNKSATNKIIFHRVIDNFVLQTGDPTGTGAGGSMLGPFDDQYNVNLQHNRTGVLSYAKLSDDTNDSQFFITEGPQRHLDFNHSIWGQLIEGESVRQGISRTAVNQSRPTQEVVINNMAIFNDPENGLIRLKAQSAAGTSQITVRVTKSSGGSFERTFLATAAPDTQNGAPFLNDITVPSIAGGNSVAIQLTAQDKENDAVFYDARRMGNVPYQFNMNNSTGQLQVTAPPNFVGTFSLEVGVRAQNASPGSPLSDIQQLVFEVIPPQRTVDLVVTKTGPASAVAGNTITYTMTATNNGPSDAINVRVSDNIPDGIRVISATLNGTAVTIPASASDTTAANPDNIDFSIGNLAAGASVNTLQIVAAILPSTPDSSLTNIVSVTTDDSLTAETTSSNNISTTNTSVTSQNDVAIIKSGPTSVLAGGDLAYTLNVSNFGPSTATNVIVADLLPAGLTFVSGTSTIGGSAAGTVSATGQNVSVAIPALNPGETALVTIRAAVGLTVAGTIINTANVTAVNDTNATNNTSSFLTSVIAGTGIISGTKFNDLNGNGIRDRGLVLGSEPDVVFVIDVSGSTDSIFQGTPVGDVNNDGDANTILDAEIAGFIALNQDLVTRGLGPIADISIVAFSNSAFRLDLDPTISGIQSTTKAGADKNVNGILDVEEALRSLTPGGNTNFEAALRESITLLQGLGTAPSNGNVVFLSDGFPTIGGDHADEAAQLRTIAGNISAFGVGTSSSLPALRIIDSRARQFTTTDELLAVFQGIDNGSGSTELFTEPGLAGVTIYLDLNNNGQLDAGEPTTLTRQDDPATTTVDELGTYQFTQLAAGTYTVREVVPSGFQQTLPGGSSRAYTITLAANAQSTGNDFGNTPAAATNSISGYVYADVDNNGVRFVTIGGTQVPQTGLPNVKIELVNTVTGAVLETRTNADGFYQFTAIADGTYLLRETQPIIFVDGIDTPGTPGLAALGGTLANDAFENLRLQGGVAATEYNFGERGLKAPYVTKSLLLASTPNSTTLAAQYDTNARFKITATSAGVLAIAGIPKGATAQLFTLDNQPLAPMEASGTAQYRVGEGESVYLVIENAAGTPTPSLLQVSIEPSEAYEAYYSGMHTNAFLAPDVNGDGWVTPIDALLIINRLNSMGTGPLRASVSDFLDVNRDNHLSPIDALMVINYLNQASSAQAEGESDMQQPTRDRMTAIDSYFASIEDSFTDETQKRRNRVR